MKYNSELDLKERNSLSILIDRIRPNSTVLEFGSANGRMTKYMTEELHCDVYAVEIDSEAAKDAAKFAKKIVVDSIENYTWQKEFEDITFDYIIFADVLEHLYNPENVLKSVNKFLKEDGSILVSIPNIAHNAIIINLLKNEFNYNSVGLLDNTHIKFFTKKTFDKLIEKTGYFRAYETATFISPEESEFKNSYSDLPEEIAEYLKSMTCGEMYQLIYEFKKHEILLKSDYANEYRVYNKKFIQLFIDKGNGMSEVSSIKLAVAQNTNFQEFTFDLTDYESIINLRLDPLNDRCVVEIEKLLLVKDDGTRLDLTTRIHADTCSHYTTSYFFDSHDPQIYIEGISSQELLDVKALIVGIYYKYIGNDALLEGLKQTKSELEQTKSELEQTKSSFSWRITKPLRQLKGNR
jgi:2-polyprenyl-3-methyl-5-hydroxy-6-metoxy-1,4-benzoquinol methylase